MQNKNNKPLLIKILNSLCACVLIVSIIFVFATGFSYVKLGIISAAIVSLATPVIMSGEGIMVVVSGIFEALFEGIMGIFEGIAEIFSGLFG